MKNNNSIGLFKEKIVVCAPSFSSQTDADIESLLWEILNLEYENKAYLAFSNELNKNGHDITEFTKELIESFADLAFEKVSNQDDVIQFLIKTKNEIFNEHLLFLTQLAKASTNIERTHLKELVQNIEENIEEKEIEEAITNLERTDRKNILRELEGNIDPSMAHANFAVANMKISSFNNKSSNTNWRFVMKIAAMIFLILIPVSISIFFFNNPEINSFKSSNGTPNEIKYAETVDLSDLQKIEVPDENIQNSLSIELMKDDYTQSYASQEEKVSIEIKSFQNQLDYLNEKIEALELTSNELKNKIDLAQKELEKSSKGKRGSGASSKELKNKIEKDIATIALLNKLIDVCQEKKSTISAMEWSYNYNKSKLIIYTNKKLDTKYLGVYSISDYSNGNKASYFLKLKDDYFSLNDRTGKLIKETNAEIIMQLEEI